MPACNAVFVSKTRPIARFSHTDVVSKLHCDVVLCVAGSPAQVLTLPSFPVSVLGTVVNKRAAYSYLRKVDAAESLTYRCGKPRTSLKQCVVKQCSIHMSTCWPAASSSDTVQPIVLIVPAHVH